MHSCWVLRSNVKCPIKRGNPLGPCKWGLDRNHIDFSKHGWVCRHCAETDREFRFEGADEEGKLLDKAQCYKCGKERGKGMDNNSVEFIMCLNLISERPGQRKIPCAAINKVGRQECRNMDCKTVLPL